MPSEIRLYKRSTSFEGFDEDPDDLRREWEGRAAVACDEARCHVVTNGRINRDPAVYVFVEGVQFWPPLLHDEQNVSIKWHEPHLAAAIADLLDDEDENNNDEAKIRDRILAEAERIMTIAVKAFNA